MKIVILPQIFSGIYPYLIIFILVLLISHWFLSRRKYSNLPPGPMGIPLLGYFPFIGREPHISFNHLSTKYGNIFHFFIINQVVIVLNDHEAIREAFVRQGDVFSGRPHLHGIEFTRGTEYGIFTTEGPLWKDTRKAIVSYQREQTSNGPCNLTDYIREELKTVIEEFEKTNTQPFNAKLLLTCAVANVVNFMLFDKRYDYNDPRLHETLAMMNYTFELARSPLVALFDFFPSVKFAPGFKRVLDRIIRMKNEMWAFGERIVSEHSSPHDQSIIRHFLDALRHDMSNKESCVTKANFSMDKHLGMVSWDLYLAGIETTSNSLDFAFLYMITHPEIQRKVQDEMDQVIGRSSLPGLDHRKDLPYTEATLCEVQRYATVVPLGVVHANVKETILCGYQIPQRSIIFSNLWAVHRDPKVWSHPTEFRPEHFLDENGKFFKPVGFMPFAVGTRRCAGEQLAKLELYLFFTTILHRFTLTLAPGAPMPSLKPISGLTNSAQPYKLIAIPRD